MLPDNAELVELGEGDLERLRAGGILKIAVMVEPPYCDCGGRQQWSDRLKMYVCSHFPEEDEADGPDGSDHFRTQG